MTIPGTDTAPGNAPAPSGIRIASTLCWVVGIVTVLVGLAIGIPAVTAGVGSLLPGAVGVVAGLAVCVAAVLIRRQRRVGVLVLVLAWALPTGVAVARGETPRGGPLLIVIALLLAAANWKHLK